MDPESQEWTIYDQDGLIKETLSETDLTQEGPGIYYVFYDVPADVTAGTWRVVCKATKNVIVGIVEKRFSVYKV